MDKKELFDYIEKKKDMFLALERLKKRYEKRPGDYFAYLTETLDWLIDDNVQKLKELSNIEKYNTMIKEYATNGLGENLVIMDLKLEADKMCNTVYKSMLNQYNRMKTTQVPKQLPYKDFVCQDIELAFECGDIEIYTPYEIGTVVKDINKAYEQNPFEFWYSEGDTSGKVKVYSVDYGCRDKRTKETIILPKIGFAEIKENVLDL